MKTEDYKVGDRLDHFGETWVIDKILRRRKTARAPDAAIIGFQMHEEYRDSFGKLIKSRHREEHPRNMYAYRLIGPDSYEKRDSRKRVSCTQRSSAVSRRIKKKR